MRYIGSVTQCCHPRRPAQGSGLTTFPTSPTPYHSLWGSLLSDQTGGLPFASLVFSLLPCSTGLALIILFSFSSMSFPLNMHIFKSYPPVPIQTQVIVPWLYNILMPLMKYSFFFFLQLLCGLLLIHFAMPFSICHSTLYKGILHYI